MLTKHHIMMLILSLPTTALHTHNPVKQKSPFSRIAQAHLASFPVIEEEKPKSLSFSQQLQPWSQATINNRDCYTSFYKSFDQSALPISTVFNECGLKDLELVKGEGQSEANVLNTLPLTTAFGEIYTAYLLDNPITNIQTLQHRQRTIHALSQDSLLMERAFKYLAAVKEREPSMLIVLKDSDANQHLVKTLFYTNDWPVFKTVKFLNKSIIFQDIVSLKNYTVAAGFSAAFVALVGISAKSFYDDPQNFTSKAAWYLLINPDKLMTTVYSLMGPYIAYVYKTAFIDPELHAQKAAIGFARLLHCVDLFAPYNFSMNTTDLIKKYTDKSQSQLSSPMKKLVNLLRKNTFKGNESYFSHHGNSKVAYALLLECKDELHELFEIVGEIDTFLACAKLIQQSEGQPNGYCFADYVEHTSKPSLQAIDIWHPLVGPQKSVTNSIELGDNHPTNIILTGPNAGGKSTFLKGLTINVLFAQSLGIVPAKKFVVTPFAKINTYMNIADDTAGGNSLFKSEVLRAQKLLDTVKNLPEGHFAFSVMDEMFSGTSPKEGEAASYAVAQKIGSLPNSMLLLATHFPKLTELESKTDTFKNYQVRVVRHENGTFSYPFKLEKGKANQNVAIEILQREGFESSILDSAYDILNS